jgi:acyl-CoA hydrolase
MLSRHCGVCATTAKETLVRGLGLKKSTRRRVSHTLSDPQKLTRVEASDELLQILKDLEADSFDGIATGDKSWFLYLYESSAMFAKSPGDVIPRTRKEINMKKTMFTIFVTNRRLVIAEDLPKGQKYSPDYFISDIFPELEREKGDITRGSKVGLFTLA